MSTKSSSVRHSVARCLLLAQRRAEAGDAAGARDLIGLALDLATPQELTAVLGAADRLLVGSSPPAGPRRAAPRAAADNPDGGPPAPPSPRPPMPEPPAPEPAYSAPARPAPRPAPRAARSGSGMARPLITAAFVGALLWGGVSLLRPGAAESPQALLSRGQALLAKGDTAAAVTVLRKSAREDAAGGRAGQHAQLLLRALEHP